MLYLLPSGEYCISLRSESGVLSEFGEKKEERSISPIIDRSRLLKKTDAVATLASLWCEGCSPLSLFLRHYPVVESRDSQLMISAEVPTESPS